MNLTLLTVEPNVVKANWLLASESSLSILLNNYDYKENKSKYLKLQLLSQETY